MYDSTKIKLKRTLRFLKSAPEGETNIQEKPIDFGEPIFVDNNNGHINNPQYKCRSYLVIGSPVSSDSDKVVRNAAVFKGFWDPEQSDKLVFYKEQNGELVGLETETGLTVPADKLTVSDVDINSNIVVSDKYYILCQPNISDTSNPNYKTVKRFNLKKSGNTDVGIYVTNNGVMHGAAWNDYAEKRHIKDDVIPGNVVCEVGDGSLVKATKRLQPCPYVITDTYGFVIGEEPDTPVAVAGRALVQLSSDSRAKVAIGDCLCADNYGKASIMTREEIKEYPDRILGIVTGIPLEDKWNGVDINNRVWIKIK